jgi:hypothetical protein
MMMNRRNTLPLGLVLGGMLVLLTAIGVVNGLWSKNLVINGTVVTGDLNVDWTDVTCEDVHGWDGDFDTELDEGEYLNKDVAWTEADIFDEDQQIMTIDIHNAYPSYAVDCEIHWSNTGTIPVQFAGYAFGSLTNDLEDCEIVTGPPAALVCKEFTVLVFDDIGQVDPDCPFGECTDTVTRSLIFHLEQPAEQSTCDPATGLQTSGPFVIDKSSYECDPLKLYNFQIKLCVAQWNEDPDGASPVLGEDGPNEGDYTACVGSAQHEGPGGTGDEDYDGVYEPDDNCPDVFNPDQTDADDDGIGAACDPDDDE